MTLKELMLGFVLFCIGMLGVCFFSPTNAEAMRRCPVIWAPPGIWIEMCPPGVRIPPPIHPGEGVIYNHPRPPRYGYGPPRHYRNPSRHPRRHYNRHGRYNHRRPYHPQPRHHGPPPRRPHGQPPRHY